MQQAIVPVDQLNELERRYVEFLPGAASVPHDVRMAMAQISIAHGLDPFLREVWPIPKMNRSREIVGWELFIGISGWRNAAHRSGEYWGRRFEKVTDEERKWLAAAPGDLVVKCIVMRRKTGQQPAEFDGYGIARPDELSKMNKFQLARLRAERDAMKAAFPISTPFNVSVAVSDDEGEVINGDHEWQLTGSNIEAHDVDITKNRHALGRDNGDLTGAYTPSAEPVAPVAPIDDPALCKLHGITMTAQHPETGAYYHKLDDGNYCNGLTIKPPKVTAKA